MGKKWKRNQRRQQRQNEDFETENVSNDFDESSKSNGQSDIHLRLGWKKPNYSMSKKQKKKHQRIQKAFALASGDVDMGMDNGVIISYKNK